MRTKLSMIITAAVLALTMTSAIAADQGRENVPQPIKGNTFISLQTISPNVPMVLDRHDNNKVNVIVERRHDEPSLAAIIFAIAIAGILDCNECDRNEQCNRHERERDHDKDCDRDHDKKGPCHNHNGYGHDNDKNNAHNAHNGYGRENDKGKGKDNDKGYDKNDDKGKVNDKDKGQDNGKGNGKGNGKDDEKSKNNRDGNKDNNRDGSHQNRR